MRHLLLGLLSVTVAACSTPTRYDVVIRNGTIYDGSGGEPIRGDVAINGDTIVVVGDIGSGVGATEIDAQGPGRRPGVHQHVELGRDAAAG